MSCIDKAECDTLWNMKALAIIAVVACHCCYVNENASRLNKLMVYVFEYWMSYGVPIFYFAAGYLFHSDEKGFRYFCKKKIKTIIIPWIFTGTLVWLYVVLRKGGMNWNNWIHYLFLKESYLYFLTDLLVFYVLFYIIVKNWRLEKCLNIFFVIGVFVAEIANVECVLENVPGKGLPIVNMLVFYMGMLFRNRKLGAKIRSTWGVLLVVPFVVIRFIQLNIIKSSSGIILNICGSMCLVIALYSFCYSLAKRCVPWLCVLGKYSFAIYLLHMPVAGMVANLLNRSEKFAVLTLWRPMIVIVITYIFITIYGRVFNERPNLMVLIGVR